MVGLMQSINHRPKSEDEMCCYHYTPFFLKVIDSLEFSSDRSPEIFALIRLKPSSKIEKRQLTRICPH